MNLRGGGVDNFFWSIVVLHFSFKVIGRETGHNVIPFALKNLSADQVDKLSLKINGKPDELFFQPTSFFSTLCSRKRILNDIIGS